MNHLKNLLKIAAVSSFALLLAGCGRKDINVSDYISLECTGYDTVGTAAYTLDIEKMIEENPEAFDLEDGTKDRAYDSVYNRLSEALTGELDKTDNLSNGDTVTFEWDDIDIEELEEIFPVTLIVSDKTLTVKGLEEAEMFDPFEYVTVTYDGIAPNGRANIAVDYDNIPVTELSFDSDTSSGLSNGDKITVTVSSYYDDINTYCLEYGMLPTNLEMEYTVDGLSKYASELSEIPQDVMDKLDEHALDSFNAYVAKKWADSESLEGIKLIGNYLLTPKDPSIYTSNQNIIYFIYEVTAKNPESEDSFTYYYYTYYTDIMILDDGTCSFDLGTMTVPSGSMFFGSVSGEAFAKGDYFYTGYEDLDSLFNKQVTAKIDSYNYESTVE